MSYNINDWKSAAKKQMKGKVHVYKRNHINTDEIIPARYLVTDDERELALHAMEDIDPDFVKKAQPGDIIVAGGDFGCGSSREHAVWVFEVNDINTVIGESFARIFRQNMFNCGMLAIELSKEDIDALFQLGGEVTISVDVENETLTAKGDKEATFSFLLNQFDKDLLLAGGWLAYADQKY